jgi:hypothetical protein
MHASCALHEEEQGQEKLLTVLSGILSLTKKTERTQGLGLRQKIRTEKRKGKKNDPLALFTTFDDRQKESNAIVHT